MSNQSTDTSAPSADQIKNLSYELQKFYKQLGHEKGSIPLSHHREVAAKLLGSPTFNAAIKKEDGAMSLTLHEGDDPHVWELDEQTLSLETSCKQQETLITRGGLKKEEFTFPITNGMARLTLLLEQAPAPVSEELGAVIDWPSRIDFIERAAVGLIEVDGIMLTAEQAAAQCAIKFLAERSTLRTRHNLELVLKDFFDLGADMFDFDLALNWAVHYDFALFEIREAEHRGSGWQDLLNT